VTAVRSFGEWFWFRWLLILLEGRNVNVMGEGWMEFGQSWPRKGKEGKPMGNEGFKNGPFQGQQGRQADVYLIIICKTTAAKTWKIGNLNVFCKN
jgi:hypothetical protein